MNTAVSFFAWVQEGFRDLTPGDISASGKNLTAPADGEEVVGDLEGDLLKTWALLNKNTKQMLAEVTAHNQKHRAGIDHSTAECDAILNRLTLTVEQNDLLKTIFWFDVQQAHGSHDHAMISLRAGMKVVRCPESPDLEPDLISVLILGSVLHRITEFTEAEAPALALEMARKDFGHLRSGGM